MESNSQPWDGNGTGYGHGHGQPEPSSPQLAQATTEIATSCLVYDLIARTCQISYEGAKGRVQYFSPSVTLEQYCDQVMRPSPNGSETPTRPSAKRPPRVLGELSTDVEQYLMDLFWTRYNKTLDIVNKEAYTTDHDRGGSKYYSEFLHITCLAMGFTFASREKPELRQFCRGRRLSVFYQEVKYALDAELEESEGITTIQALMILSDLECALGRKELGWLYSGKSKTDTQHHDTWTHAKQ